MTLRVGVVGAGVVGLSTALRILEEIPEVRLEILADKFETETTSDGAAGIFRPDITHYQQLSREDLWRWSKASWDRFHHLFFTPEAAKIGISQLSGYHVFSHHNAPDPIYKDIVYHLSPLTAQELDAFPPGGKHWKSGFLMNTLMIECRNYLPWLSAKVKGRGGKINMEKVEDLKDLRRRFDVVVNCCGLGARELVGDLDVVPIRGQIIRAHAPFLKNFYFFDNDCYVIPGAHTVVIGGVRQLGNFSVDVSQEDKDELWRLSTSRLPILHEATTLWDWAGLRPHRDPIRIEAETLTFEDGGFLPVVHNYGHGGHGVTLSWGTAVDAVELVKHSIIKNYPSFKLLHKANL